MKKAVLITSIIVSMFLSMIQPFSVFAISGFDDTNYYLLDYIESHGTEYINTGISHYGGVSHEIDFEFTSKSTKSYIFGAGASYRWDRFGINTNGTVFYEVRNKTVDWSNDRVNLTIMFTGSSVSGSEYGDVNNNTLYFSGINTNTLNNTNIYIFACNNGSSAINKSSAKLYEYIIYNSSDIAVAHFYPAMRKADNAIGLYDVIRSQFFSNSGTGSFEYGGIIPSQYTISTSVSPSGSGVVTGAGTYDSGTSIQIEAIANTGYSFVRWSDNVYTNPRSVLVNSSQSFTAIFQQQDTPLTQYTISTSVSPSGSGSVSGGGTYDSGSTITLTATPNNGYIFSRWSDGVTNSSRSVNVTGNMSFTAEFILDSSSVETYTINTSVSPSGSGTVSGGGIYEYGDTVTLTANANSGYVFASWSDGLTQNPRNIQVTSNLNLIAYFTEDVSSQTILGVNVNIIDYDNSNSIQYWGSIDNNGIIILYPQPYDNTYPAGGSPYIIPSTYVYYFDFVFNDDYIGDFGFRFNATDTNINRTLYVNGNHAQISFAYDKGYDLTGGTFTFYNLNHLVKKQTTQNLIQDGTQETIESSNGLDDANQNLINESDEYNQLESGFNNDMNSALDDIDTQFNPSSFGSKFQASAIWVSDQFNELTSDSPFGSFLGFSLLLGLSLLIIGRVFG